jgi:hypothetical protein
MSAAPKTVELNELAFFFQTNEPIPARPLLDFLYEVERIARTRRYLGSDERRSGCTPAVIPPANGSSWSLLVTSLAAADRPSFARFAPFA